MGRLSLIPAAYVFLEKDGKFLFIRRVNTGYRDGYYQPPAGHVEEQETAREAAAREAREEVGVEIDPGTLEFVHVVYRMHEDKTGYRTDIFFKTTVWEGEPQNMEEEKCDDLAWASVDALPENVDPVVLAALRGMSKGEFLTEFVM